MENSNSIKETLITDLQYDEEGRKTVNQYLFLSTIGKGSYGKVKLCLNTNDNKYYAVKIINKMLLKKKKKGYGRDSEGNMTIIYMLEDALNEVEILKLLNKNGGHKNVIKLYEIIKDDEKEKIYLILEHCARGSIMQYNDRTGVFSINKAYKVYSEEILKGFAKDIAEGLQYIHSQNIIHRDIKTDNLLIDENGCLKFSDFSIASVIRGEDQFSKTEGNLYFYPPEFCNDNSKKVFAGKPVDVWASGVTLYIATFLKMPFMPSIQTNLLELFKIIEQAIIPFSENRSISEDLKDLFCKMLEKDPTKRITPEEILSHSFVLK